MMDLTEDFIAGLVSTVHGTSEIPFGETTLSFARPWNRLSMADAVKEYAGIDVLALPEQDLQRLAEEKVPDEFRKTFGQRLAAGDSIRSREYLPFFFEELVEEKLIQPTFIYDFRSRTPRLQNGTGRKRDSLNVSSCSSWEWRSQTGSPN
jgi:lysyl-tRNA synthetase class 2